MQCCACRSRCCCELECCITVCHACSQSKVGSFAGGHGDWGFFFFGTEPFNYRKMQPIVHRWWLLIPNILRIKAEIWRLIGMNDLHSYSAWWEVTQLIQNLTGLFDDDATTVTVDAKTPCKSAVKCYEGLVGLLQYHNLFTACQHPCGHKVTLLRQHFMSRNATQPLKCKGRYIAAVQFPSSPCLFQIIPWPVVRERWPFIWENEDLIFLMMRSSFFIAVFLPVPFFCS